MNKLRPQPQLHPETWRELRQLWKLHGRNKLLDALDWLVEQDSFERRRHLEEVERQEKHVTKQTVWEKCDHNWVTAPYTHGLIDRCTICGQERA